MHPCLQTHPTGLTSSSPHPLLHTMRHQNNLSDEQGGPWRAPRSGVPPPRDHTSEICSECDSSYTCDSPVRVGTPEMSLTHHSPAPRTHPALIHTHTCTYRGHWHQWGHGRGVQPGLRCKTPPVRFNFHLPTTALCNWWHKWPPAARLSCFLLSCLPPDSFPQFALISAKVYFSQLLNFTVSWWHTHKKEKTHNVFGQCAHKTRRDKSEFRRQSVWWMKS